MDSPLSREQRSALGPLDGLPPAARRALSGRGFAPLPPPGPSDWLTVHPDRGQTFSRFVDSRPNLPEAHRRTLFLVPIGEMPPETAAARERLREYLAAFYALPAHLSAVGFSEDARWVEERLDEIGAHEGARRR